MPTSSAAELAEDLQAYLPPLRGVTREELEGAVLEASTWPDPTFSRAVRLRDPDVEAIRRWFRARGRADFTWWIGPNTRLAPIPGEPFGRYAAMVLTEEPPPAPEIEVRRIETFDDYLLAQELSWDAWRTDAATRALQAESARDRWDARRGTAFLAYVDGRPAGRAAAIPLPGAVALTGGAVARWAQGRGAYRALVRARWEAAGGLPLVTHAAPDTSQPILERLGFRVACMLDVRREEL